MVEVVENTFPPPCGQCGHQVYYLLLLLLFFSLGFQLHRLLLCLLHQAHILAGAREKLLALLLKHFFFFFKRIQLKSIVWSLGVKVGEFVLLVN